MQIRAMNIAGKTSRNNRDNKKDVLCVKIIMDGQMPE
jgi:hypothetical protein